MNWLKCLILNWLAPQMMPNLEVFIKKYSAHYFERNAEMQRSLQVFMDDSREAMRKDAQKPDESERRHKELVAAIESLKR